MKTVRVKPGKAVSAVGMVVGILMGLFGIFSGLLTQSGFFGVIWVGVVLVVVIFSAINAFTERGVAIEEFEVEDEKINLPFDEQLRRLESLRREKLISEREYQHQRKKLLS
jgi:hypothetical protein